MPQIRAVDATPRVWARRGVALSILPPDDAYACTQCGACCRRPWTIGVTDEEHARYAAIDWSQHAPALRDRALWTRAGGAWLLAREPSGACVFLEASNLCLIHRVLGFSAKPQSCQSFPYTFIETPTGVRTSLSWATFGRRSGEAPEAEVVARELEPALVRDRAAHATFHVEDAAMVALVDVLRAFVLRSGVAPIDVEARLVALWRLVGAIERGVVERADLLAVRRNLEAPIEWRPPHWLPGRLGLVAALPLLLAAPIREPDDLLRTLRTFGRGIITEGWAPPCTPSPAGERAGARGSRRAASRPARLDRILGAAFDGSPAARRLWAQFLADTLLDGLMVSPDDLRGLVRWATTLYGHARWLAKYAAARDDRETVTTNDVRWALAEAPSATGPHWGTLGRIVRRLSRQLDWLYGHPGYLGAFVMSERG